MFATDVNKIVCIQAKSHDYGMAPTSLNPDTL
jgi:hypothetical protein